MSRINIHECCRESWEFIKNLPAIIQTRRELDFGHNYSTRHIMDANSIESYFPFAINLKP